MVCYSGEKVGLHEDGARGGAGCEIERFRIAELVNVRVKDRKDGGRRQVRVKGCDLCFEITPNFDTGRDRWKRNRLTVRQRRGRSGIVKLLPTVGLCTTGE